MNVETFFQPTSPPPGAAFGAVFISHSHEDWPAARQMSNLLRERGIASFVCSDDIPKGEHWLQEIKARIDEAPSAIVIASKNANESKWVWCEIGLLLGRFANRLQKDKASPQAPQPVLAIVRADGSAESDVTDMYSRITDLKIGVFTCEPGEDFCHLSRGSLEHEGSHPVSIERILDAIQKTIAGGWRHEKTSASSTLEGSERLAQRVAQAQLRLNDLYQLKWQWVDVVFEERVKGWEFRSIETRMNGGKIDQPFSEEIQIGCRVVRFGTGARDADYIGWLEHRVRRLTNYGAVDLPPGCIEKVDSQSNEDGGFMIRARIPVHIQWGTEYVFYARLLQSNGEAFESTMRTWGFNYSVRLPDTTDPKCCYVLLPLPLTQRNSDSSRDSNEKTENKKTVVVPTVPAFPTIGAIDLEQMRHNYMFPV